MTRFAFGVCDNGLVGKLAVPVQWVGGEEMMIVPCCRASYAVQKPSHSLRFMSRVRLGLQRAA